jgi:hypothetical protein
VTNPSDDSVSKVSPDPAAAGKAASAEPAQTAEQQGQGGSGGGGSPTTPEVAPVSEQPVTPDTAPVYDTEPSVTPETAPVAPVDPRPQFGYDLAKLLLAVLGGTIVLLWIYILVLDSIETKQVNESYSRIIAAAEPTSNSPEIRRIDAVLEMINSLRTPERIFTPEVTAATRELVRQIAGLQPPQIVELNQCVQLTQPTENSQPAPPQATAANQPGQSLQTQPQTAPTGPVQPGTKERTALIERCIKTLESVRYAFGGPMDTDRLRVMRDFAKDVHDHHQGLRTFWASASQLVLVNVLLPLLTALLGYIFGRQASG